MAYRVQVLTSWRIVNDENRMAVAEDYPAEWSDSTGQADANLLPDPNLFVAKPDRYAIDHGRGGME